jgi:hypothetical protein
MYKTLAELKAAYESGELSKEDSVLTIDTDSTVVYAEGHPQADEYGLVFEGGSPEDLLKEALDILGIPWQDPER